MAELVDAHDSNSCVARRVGSIPTFGTKRELLSIFEQFPFLFPSTKFSYFWFEVILPNTWNKEVAISAKTDLVLYIHIVKPTAMKKIIFRSSLLLYFISGSFCQAQLPQFTLYGMTIQGGNYSGGNIFQWPIGGGLFKSDYDFGNNGDGSAPWGSLVQANNGLLYGMTKSGGTGLGIIFSFNAANDTEVILHKFTNGGDGAAPFGSLIQATNGLLYGMTTAGGVNGSGAIISYNLATDSEQVLYSFSSDTSNGQYPYGSLIQAGNGLLYGMTQRGGANDSGVIFSFNISTGVEMKLHDFGYGTDAAYPSGSLMQASDSLIYGMSYSGGINNTGALFSYNIATGRDSVLHSFLTDSTDGLYPYGSLIQATNGLLYGVTEGGGRNHGGMMFSFNVATSVFSDLHDFGSINQDGVRPEGTLMQASDGNLYGMTSAGGSNIDGTAFSYDPTDSIYNLLNFTGFNAYLPYYGALIEVNNIATGINQVTANANISVFPNPSTGQFTLKFPDNQTDYAAEIYDMIGEKMYQTFVSNSQSTINLNGYPNGLYLIYLKSASGVTMGKVLITK